MAEPLPKVPPRGQIRTRVVVERVPFGHEVKVLVLQPPDETPTIPHAVYFAWLELGQSLKEAGADLIGLVTSAEKDPPFTATDDQRGSTILPEPPSPEPPV